LDFNWRPGQMTSLDPGRAVSDLRALRELTGDERGAQRLAWTDTWARARDWLRERLAELPVHVDADEAGNLWAPLPGWSERTVVLGRRVDSVPDGGWLDGALGVLAGGSPPAASARRTSSPMDARRDALVAAARLVLEVRAARIAAEEGVELEWERTWTPRRSASTRAWSSSRSRRCTA
jgi:hypothetical protein